MIVRIATEDQYRLHDELAQRLNEIDNSIVTAVEEGDEGRFQELYDSMLELVRSEGEHLGDDELHGSDIILPPPDLTFEEAQSEFTGEGLIPD